jgi:ribonuclease Y
MSNDNESRDTEPDGGGTGEGAVTEAESTDDATESFGAGGANGDEDEGDEAEGRAAELDDREAALDDRAERLDQREDGLDKRADDLKARTTELDERESDLRDRRRELDDLEAELEDRQATIEQREADLDEREAAIEQREAELDERATQLDRHESTLENYLGNEIDGVEESLVDTVQDAVWSAMDNYAANRDASTRLGTVGNLVLGLVGLVLVAGGVGIGIVAAVDGSAALFDGTTTNYGVAVVVALVGLGANLAAATNRV